MQDHEELMEHTLSILCAAEAADEAGRKLSDWIGTKVVMRVKRARRDDRLSAVAILSVDGSEIHRMWSCDPVSAVDELTSWAWQTLIIATGMCILGGQPAAEA